MNLMLIVGLLVVIVTVLTDRKHTRASVDLLFGVGFMLTMVGLIVATFGD